MWQLRRQLRGGCRRLLRSGRLLRLIWLPRQQRPMHCTGIHCISAAFIAPPASQYSKHLFDYSRHLPQEGALNQMMYLAVSQERRHTERMTKRALQKGGVPALQAKTVQQQHSAQEQQLQIDRECGKRHCNPFSQWSEGRSRLAISRQASCGCTLGCNVLWSGFCVGRGAVFLLGLGTVGPQPRQESARAVGHELRRDKLPALRLFHSNRAHLRRSRSWEHF